MPKWEFSNREEETIRRIAEEQLRRGVPVTNTDELSGGVMRGAAVTSHPEWDEDANSPFTFSGAAEVSCTLADTGHDEYLVVIKSLQGGNVTAADVTLTFSGATSYDYVDNSDTRTANASVAALHKSLGSVGLTGVLVFGDTSRDSDSAAFGAVADVASHYAQTGAVTQISTQGASYLTSLTIDHANVNSWTAEIEVYHR